MAVGGKEWVPSSSYSFGTPRQLLHAARKRSEAYLDVVLGIHGQCADVGVSVDERNGAPLEMAANVVSRRGTRGWERTHRARMSPSRITTFVVEVAPHHEIPRASTAVV